MTIFRRRADGVEPSPAQESAPVPGADAVARTVVDPPKATGVEAPVPQVAPVSRAGRNMPIATIVGVTILVGSLAIAWWDERVFSALLMVVCVAAVLEWRTALRHHDRRIAIVPIILATLGLGVATYFGGPEGLVVALMVACAGVVAWRVADERIENTMADAMASILTLLWIPFLASFLILMEVAGNGWERVLILVLAVVGNDTGGLLTGMMIGKHPMAPRVSPKKTWEGFAGGVVLGTVAASVAAYLAYDGRWWIGAAAGAAGCLAAVVGDLCESVLKRDLQVKDMSSLIPGHGGILDRLDSILVAAPAGYVVFAFFLGAT